MNEEMLILVNEQDEPIGSMPKTEVHLKGLLHRAFSVFLFNSRGEMLLQQRALHKYHSAGLWSNTCCSHPRVDETVEQAVKRRLVEEMGLTADVQFLYTFKYKATLENGYTEHELDHVYYGVCDAIPLLNQDEVKDWRYVSLDAVKIEMQQHPEKFTAWFKICFPEMESRLKHLVTGTAG